jgi:hypothetical protein
MMQLGRPGAVGGFAPPPVELSPGLWTLERRLRMPGGPSLPSRTTLVRLATGDLLVVSPPASESGGLAEIDALGRVAEVLLPNSFHYLNAATFGARHPEAMLRLAPGLRQRVPALPPGEEIGDATPGSWQGVLEHTTLGPSRGVSEVALFHRPSATVILTDVAFHVLHHTSGPERAVWRLLGVPPGFGPSRSARRLLLADRALASAFLERILRWPFARVLVAHGDPLEVDAVGAFRRAFASYLS